MIDVTICHRSELLPPNKIIQCWRLTKLVPLGPTSLGISCATYISMPIISSKRICYGGEKLYMSRLSDGGILILWMIELEHVHHKLPHNLNYIMGLVHTLLLHLGDPLHHDPEVPCRIIPVKLFAC